jgi:maltokinase
VIDLTTFLSAARWFGGKGRPYRLTDVYRVGLVPHLEPGGPRVAVELVTVEYDDAEGGSDFYQLPLSCYPEPQERLSHAFVGTTADDPDLGECYLYDAVHDRDAMAGWLTSFSLEDSTGALVFHRVAGHELDLTTHSTLLSGEQSNSSVAFGEDALMKVFRRVTPGVNPDIAIHEVLTRAGSERVAALYGWVEAPMPTDPDGPPLQLAMLQQFLRTASDGWELARASGRNLFVEADLHADEVGGDFAGEAARLGEAVASVHRDLETYFEVETADLAQVAGRMSARLDAAVTAVPELAEHHAALSLHFDRLAALGKATVQRVHGDLHLGQTLRTVKGWKIVDFEGEPAKPLAERSLPDSVWRDVAGMLRSFDYAPRVVEMTLGADDPDEASQRAFRSLEWADRNSAAFLASYADRELTEDEQTQLTAYLCDKAVYETVYEARNRPTWLSIPLAAVARLAQPLG